MERFLRTLKEDRIDGVRIQYKLDAIFRFLHSEDWLTNMGKV